MRSRVLWRRSATAVGIYSATALGFLSTLIAARSLGPHAFGLFAVVVSASGFFQSLLDITVEEALVKYGFRYITTEHWGKLRQLFVRALQFKTAGGLLGTAAMAAIAPATHAIFGARGLLVPFLIVAPLPLVQMLEGPAGVALILRGRYDVRSFMLALSMGLKLVGIGVGSQFGVTQAAAGLMLAQVVSTLATGAVGWFAFHRFPRAAPASIRDDRRSIISFVAQSTLATTIVSGRSTLGPLLLGVVTNPVQVGLFRVAMAPSQALASLSAPIRLILLTEQTRDWERGELATVFAGVRRFTLGAVAFSIVAMPVLWFLMPDLVRIVYGAKYSPAVTAARIVTLSAGVQLVVAWSKSLPVSIGRPGLRVVTHGIEVAVFIPLVVLLGMRWDAAGAAAAVLISSIVFAIVWLVLIVRIRRDALPA
jgi:O-antigen/teichoic acid export membrane protein